MGYGLNGHLGLSAQQSFKTATTSYDFIPFISETITTQIEELIEENMVARFDENDSQPGILQVTGDIVIEPNPTLIGHFLRGVTGQASSTAVGSQVSWQFLPKQTDFSSDFALPPYTMEIFLDVGSAYQITDAMFTSLSFDISGGQILKATAGVMARVSSLIAKTTPSFVTGDPWTWDQASLSLDGAGNTLIENMTIAMDNPIEGIPILDNTQLFGRFKRTGPRVVTVNGDMDFSDQTEFNKFRSNSHQPIILTFTGKTETASGNFDVLKFDLPKFRYSTYPIEATGPNRISVAFEGKGKFDTSSSYSLLTTLVNTRTSYAN